MSRDPSTNRAGRRHRVHRSMEVAAPAARAFACWTCYEDLPRVMESVRRTKCIGDQRVLWDVDIAGRQLVWEAAIVDMVPHERVRWETRSGACHDGEVRFEEIAPGRTRITVEIRFRPRGLLERLGARLGLVDLLVGLDLERFASFLERAVAGAPGRGRPSAWARGRDALAGRSPEPRR